MRQSCVAQLAKGLPLPALCALTWRIGEALSATELTAWTTSIFTRCLTAILLALLLQPASADWLHQDADIMGTRITVELYHDDPAIARRGVAAVLQEMRRIDGGMSPFDDDTELARLNREAPKAPFSTSEELFGLIKRSLEFSKLTHGAFDITFASAGFLYDYRSGQRPDDDERREAARHINYRKLMLDPDHHSIRFTDPEVRIDLGGIAKGYAVDRCIAILQQLGIRQALVTAGGDSRMIGDRWGRPWTIGIRDPRRADGLAAVIPLQDVAVSTSGDYQRYFVEDGVRYHHILDPKTGDSARGLQSVTIIGPDATTTDALSTSVFVLGLDAGMKLVDHLPGISAILIDGKGELHYSSDLQPAAESANSTSPAGPGHDR